MNKYEQYSHAKEGPKYRVLRALQTPNSQKYWAGLAEALDRPEIFPLQTPLHLRTQALVSALLSGFRFVYIHGWDYMPNGDIEYRIAFSVLPPSVREYRHISKLWEECK